LREPPSDPSDTVARYVRDGLHISLLVLFAQTGLLGVTFGTLLLPPADVGVYTVAFRVSQLILFPVIGSTQLILPLASRIYTEEQLPRARSEIRHTIRISLALMIASNIGFAVLGAFLLRTVMGIADPAAYVCTLILSAGNLGMAVFGIGDQIMIAIGKQRKAFWISVFTSAILFLVLASIVLFLRLGITGLACAAALPVTVRALVGYLVVRRTVRVPVAAFD
jgi:O-antigen/teichoic acid export membrane protein